MENSFLEKFDIRYYWQIFLRRKWFIIIFGLVSIALAIFWILSTKPVYEAKSVIRVSYNQHLISKSVERVIPGARTVGAATLLWRNILSYENIQRLIDVLHLKDDPDVDELYQEAQQIKLKHPNFSIDEIVNTLLVDRLKKNFSVKQRGMEFIEISGRGPTSEKTYLLVETLASIFIEGVLKEELSGIRSSLEFSSDQLEVYKSKLTESERRLEKFKQELALTESEDIVGIAKKVDQADSIISSIDVSIREKQNELKRIDKQLDGFLRKLSLPDTPEIKKIKNDLTSSITRLSDVSMRFSWRDGESIRLTREIIKLKNQLQELIREITYKKLNTRDEAQTTLYFQKQMVLIDLETLRNRRLAMQNIRRIYKKKLEERPLISLTMNRLEQEVNAFKQIYDLFLQQARGSEIEQALQRTEAEYKLKIIEPAVKPLDPIKPNKKKILIICLFLGASLGVGTIFGLEYIDQSYKDVETVERELNLPVLGIVPKLGIDEEHPKLIPNLLIRIVTPVLIFIIVVIFVIKFKLIHF